MTRCRDLELSRLILPVHQLSASLLENCDNILIVKYFFSITHGITAAVNGMKKNKTPGSSGLIVEFFFAFWDFVGPKVIYIITAV